MSVQPHVERLSFGLPSSVLTTWDGLHEHVRTRMSPLRSVLVAEGTLPMSLELSMSLLDVLADPVRRRHLARLLAEERLSPVGVDSDGLGWMGTPKGRRHRPDWRDEDRLFHTIGLAELLTDIAPGGRTLTISTLPGADRELAASPEAQDDIADAMLRAAAYLCDLEKRTGRHVALAVEPAPFGLLETVAEAAAFFEGRLYSARAERRFVSLADLPARTAPAQLRRYLGICYDTAHAAVMDEEPTASLSLLRGGGIPVHRLQLSAAARIEPPSDQALAVLGTCGLDRAPVVAVGKSARGTTLRIRDLDAWLLQRGRRHRDGLYLTALLRLPVSVERIGPIGTTRAFVSEVLAEHRRRPIAAEVRVVGGDRKRVPAELWAESEEETAQRDVAWVRRRLA